MDTYCIFIIHDMDRISRHPPTERLPRGFRFLCQPLTQVRLGTCLSSPPQQHPQRDPDTASHLLTGGTKGRRFSHPHIQVTAAGASSCGNTPGCSLWASLTRPGSSNPESTPWGKCYLQPLCPDEGTETQRRPTACPKSQTWH